MNVLVVCGGNTCRSPMAAGLLRVMTKSVGILAEVESAGLAHHPNGQVAGKAIEAMREIGIDISDDYSKPVSPELLQWADIVVAVEQRHADHIVEEYPRLTVRIICLEPDVPDPYNGDLPEYRETRDLLKRLLPKVVSSLSINLL